MAITRNNPPHDINTQLRHGAAVALLEEYGFAPPPEYVQLRDRLTRYKAVAGSDHMTARLVDAVLNGGDQDVAALRSQASAEHARARTVGTLVASGSAAYAVDQAVEAAAVDRLRAIYDDAATGVYAAVASKYGDITAEFAGTVRQIDPRLSAAEVIDLDAKTQKAWRQGQALTDEVSEWALLLTTAAMLCGLKHPHPEGGSAGQRWHDGWTSLRLGLTVDATGAHRRRVWENCSDWAGLVLTPGVVLRATPIEIYEPYRAPRPMMERRNLDATVTVYDPEDLVEPPERPADDTAGDWHPATAPAPVADPFEVHTHR
jgi:hypothetical protein